MKIRHVGEGKYGIHIKWSDGTQEYHWYLSKEVRNKVYSFARNTRSVKSKKKVDR